MGIIRRMGETMSLTSDIREFHEKFGMEYEGNPRKLTPELLEFRVNFIKEEFDRLGYNYSRQIICTVKESRKWLPGYKSYSLGKLCNQLGISIEGRHRAHGDALATVSLFSLNVSKASEKSWLLSLKAVPIIILVMLKLG